MLYSFGDYTLDAEHYELRQAGRLVPVEPRVLDVLTYLVQALIIIETSSSAYSYGMLTSKTAVGEEGDV
jgi:hypothetical protein